MSQPTSPIDGPDLDRPLGAAAPDGGTWKWESADGVADSVRELIERWDDLESFPGAEVLKSNVLRTVLGLPASDGRPAVVVKRYHLRNRRERLKFFFFASRALSEWRALRHLRDAGVRVPLPLAFGEERMGTGVFSSLARAGLIMERLELVSPLAQWLADVADPEERQQVFVELSGAIARLHDCGVRHSDLHAGNILISSDPTAKSDGAPSRVHLIDHHVCRIGRDPVGERGRRRDLGKFFHSLLPSLEPGEARNLLVAYDQSRQQPTWGESGVVAIGEEVQRRAHRLEQIRLGSRSRRCWKTSSGFVREDCDGWRVYRRRELSLESLRPLLTDTPELESTIKKRGTQVVGTTTLKDAVPSAGGAPDAPEHQPKSISVVVKQREYQGLLRRLAYLFVRGPLEQAWGAARALDVRGIPNPRALALLVKSRGGLAERAVLVTERVEGARSLWSDLMERYYPPTEKSRAGLQDRIPPLARLVRRFHDTGIYHRDLNPQNVLLNSNGTGDSFFVIDLDSIVAGRRLTERRRKKNLIQLGLLPEGHISVRDRLRFLSEYDRGEGRFYTREWIHALDAGLSDEVVDMIGRMSVREWATAQRSQATPPEDVSDVSDVSESDVSEGSPKEGP